jgi:hypothetical protein
MKTKMATSTTFQNFGLYCMNDWYINRWLTMGPDTFHCTYYHTSSKYSASLEDPLGIHPDSSRRQASPGSAAQRAAELDH